MIIHVEIHVWNILMMIQLRCQKLDGLTRDSPSFDTHLIIPSIVDTCRRLRFSVHNTFIMGNTR